MTRVYNSTGKVRDHYINKFMVENPGITEGEAYELYCEELRQRGSKGGRAPGGAFSHVPGLAQRAARLSRKKK